MNIRDRNFDSTFQKSVAICKYLWLSVETNALIVICSSLSSSQYSDGLDESELGWTCRIERSGPAKFLNRDIPLKPKDDVAAITIEAVLDA